MEARLLLTVSDGWCSPLIFQLSFHRATPKHYLDVQLLSPKTIIACKWAGPRWSPDTQLKLRRTWGRLKFADLAELARSFRSRHFYKILDHAPEKKLSFCLRARLNWKERRPLTPNDRKGQNRQVSGTMHRNVGDYNIEKNASKSNDQTFGVPWKLFGENWCYLWMLILDRLNTVDGCWSDEWRLTTFFSNQPMTYLFVCLISMKFTLTEFFVTKQIHSYRTVQ